jgi:hypothetical protein
MTARGGMMIIAAAALLALPGCIGEVIGIIAAPEAVAVQAAGSAATSAVNSAITDANAVSDVDRILSEHPDAANAAELRSLRDQLAADQPASMARRENGRHFAVDERHDFDRRWKPAATQPVQFQPHSGDISLQGKTPGHQLVREPLKPLGAEHPDRREQPKPYHLARDSSLDEWKPRFYGLSIGGSLPQMPGGR